MAADFVGSLLTGFINLSQNNLSWSGSWFKSRKIKPNTLVSLFMWFK